MSRKKLCLALYLWHVALLERNNLFFFFFQKSCQAKQDRRTKIMFRWIFMSSIRWLAQNCELWGDLRNILTLEYILILREKDEYDIIDVFIIQRYNLFICFCYHLEGNTGKYIIQVISLELSFALCTLVLELCCFE